MTPNQANKANAWDSFLNKASQPEVLNFASALAGTAEQWVSYSQSRQQQSQLRMRQGWAKVQGLQAQVEANKEYLQRSAIALAQLKNAGHGGRFSSPNLASQKLKDLQQLENERRKIKLNAAANVNAIGYQIAAVGKEAGTDLALGSVTNYLEFSERAGKISDLRNATVDGLTGGTKIISPTAVNDNNNKPVRLKGHRKDRLE